MYPFIDLGFTTIKSFEVARAIMVAVALGVFVSEWKRKFGATFQVVALGIGTFVVAITAGKAGSIAWDSFRPTVLHSIFGVSPFWVQEATGWLFAGVLYCLFVLVMFLRGTGQSVATGLDAFAPSLAIAQVI